MESQAVFQAETQAKNVFIESPPWFLEGGRDDDVGGGRREDEADEVGFGGAAVGDVLPSFVSCA